MERRIDVRLSLSYEPRVLRPWLVFCLLLLCAADLTSENVTLTTYYPAPSGMYTQLITTQQTILARDSGNVGIGTAGPAYKLDVRGTANFTENLTAASLSVITNETVGGKLQVNGDATFIGSINAYKPHKVYTVTVDAINNGGGAPCESCDGPHWHITCATRYCRNLGHAGGIVGEYSGCALTDPASVICF